MKVDEVEIVKMTINDCKEEALQVIDKAVEKWFKSHIGGDDFNYIIKGICKMQIMELIKNHRDLFNPALTEYLDKLNALTENIWNTMQKKKLYLSCRRRFWKGAGLRPCKIHRRWIFC